ncbi:MAG: hypothetical protein IJP23_00750 [Oscillospiraceae bacterium]|nr:hypothetical protein [Oscillospiraceae bacterium]
MKVFKTIVTPFSGQGPRVWVPESGMVMSRDDCVCSINTGLTSGADRVEFIFSGPEPMLAGIDFFKTFIEIENEYLRPGQEAVNILCTSGVYLDEAWADFIRDCGIQVRLVIDGAWDEPGALSFNDAWKHAARGAELLARRDLDVAGIIRVTASAARRAGGIYNGIKKVGFDHCRIIPWTLPAWEMEEAEWALRPGQLEMFLKTLFDRWYKDREIGIEEDLRPFSEYVKIMAGIKNGAARGENAQCQACRWAPYCGMRAVDYPDDNYPDVFCETYRWFFEYAEKKLEKLAKVEKQLSWH